MATFDLRVPIEAALTILLLVVRFGSRLQQRFLPGSHKTRYILQRGHFSFHTGNTAQSLLFLVSFSEDSRPASLFKRPIFLYAEAWHHRPLLCALLRIITSPFSPPSSSFHLPSNIPLRNEERAS